MDEKELQQTPAEGTEPEQAAEPPKTVYDTLFKGSVAAVCGVNGIVWSLEPLLEIAPPDWLVRGAGVVNLICLPIMAFAAAKRKKTLKLFNR